MRHPSSNSIAPIRWLAVLCLVLASGAAVAQRTPTAAPVQAPEQRVALVIGNAAYKAAPLRNPVNDATDMAATLRSLGFAVTLRTNADTRQMRTSIREFAQNLKRGGVGLFYYAGHGVQSRSGKNYLIPVGADIKEEFELEDEAVDANRVLAGMEEAGNRINLVILDACRDNPFARSWRSGATSGLAQMNAPSGSFVGFSTAPGSVAADGSGRNGIFTRHLLDNLKAGDPDIDKVFTRVTAAVARETGNKQVPWKSSSLTGDFHFRPPAGGAQAVVAPTDPAANERALWDTVKDSKSAEELKAYLEQFPRGLFAGVAQSRLKALQSTQIASAPSSTTIQQAPPAGAIAAMSRGTVFRDCADCPEMVVIPPGSFTMGSPERETDRDPDEGPQHPVSIRQAFAAGKYEVSKAQFRRFVAESGHSVGGGCYWWTGSKFELDAAKSWRSPGFAQTENDPVACVSWEDAKAYTRWLSQKTGKTYRLLTEAEWEYAARAGTSTAFSFGSSITSHQANYNTTASYAGSPTAASRGGTVPVGSYPANAFGLHDMHGNVWEWTEDCWNANYNGAPSDGSSWTAGDCGQRVLRGGSWNGVPRSLRSAIRLWNPVGFRFSVRGLRVSRTQ